MVYYHQPEVEMMPDIRLAVRTLFRARGFFLTATLTLGLGLGATVTVFSTLNGVLLRAPRHVRAPERLVALFTSDFSGPLYSATSYPDYEDLRTERVFDGVAIYESAPVAIGAGAETRPHVALAVSPNFFDVLGTLPAAGRFFRADDGDVVVVSHGFWREHLGGNPSALGKSLLVNGVPFTIIGVAPAAFAAIDRSVPADLWLTTDAAARPGLDITSNERDSRGALAFARLADGVTIERAQQRMNALAAAFFATYPDQWRDVTGNGRKITLLPESRVRVPPTLRGDIVTLMTVLLVAVALLLLLCCASVAGLLVARAAGRTREMGVRLSLGAPRSRLIRQLLAESAVLALAGALIGTTLAYWGTELVALAQQESPLGVIVDVAPDLRVLAFALTVAVATVLIFGLVPALQASRIEPLLALRASIAAGASRGQVRVRAMLVGAQIALSTLLLVGALLFARAVQAAYRIDPGFNTDNVLVVFASPLAGQQGGPDPLSVALQLQERIAALPGVSSVSWGSNTPLAGAGSRRTFAVHGYQPQPGEDMEFHVNEVGPAFFETIGIPIVRGRAFDGTERSRQPDVAIVNESFARRHWPGQDPVGQHLTMSRRNELTVIGVARDARYLSVTQPARPYVFLSALQRTGAIRLFVRATRDPRALVPRVADELEAVAPGWVLANPTTLHDQIGRLLFQQRAAGALIGTFAALAVILACVGLYGVVAFAVAQRTREIGIRVALGARPAAVVQLFLRRAVPIVALGAAAGIVGALMFSRVIASLLIGVTAHDPAAFIGGALLLAAVAFIASWIPAYRASRVDPLTALRAE